jgi:hypothetical protein
MSSVGLNWDGTIGGSRFIAQGNAQGKKDMDAGFNEASSETSGTVQYIGRNLMPAPARNGGKGVLDKPAADRQGVPAGQTTPAKAATPPAAAAAPSINTPPPPPPKPGTGQSVDVVGQ